MKLKQLTKRSMYKFISQFFELDKCKWYDFKRVDARLYYLTGLGFEYVLNYSFGCLRIACRDIDNGYKEVKTLFWDLIFPDQRESMKNFDIFEDIDNLSPSSCDSVEASEDSDLVTASSTHSNVSVGVSVNLSEIAAHESALDGSAAQRLFSQPVAGSPPRLPT